MFHVDNRLVPTYDKPLQRNFINQLTSLGFLDNDGFSTIKNGQFQVTTQKLSKRRKEFALTHHPDKIGHLPIQQRKKRQQEMKIFNGHVDSLQSELQKLPNRRITLHPSINYKEAGHRPPFPSFYTRRG
jgi:hypothetical protein